MVFLCVSRLLLKLPHQQKKKQNYLSFGDGCIPMRAYSLSIKLAQRNVAKSTVDVVTHRIYAGTKDHKHKLNETGIVY